MDSANNKDPVSLLNDSDDKNTANYDKYLISNKHGMNAFFSDKQIILNGIPNVNTEDIQEYMEGIEVVKISIHVENQQAFVTLGEGEDVKDVFHKLSSRKLMALSLITGRNVPGTFVCVTRLPENFSDADFRTLMESSAKVKKSFLMRSLVTGESKGYGMVEFDVEPSELGRVCKEVDERQVDGVHLECDVVSHGSLFDNFNSKCILVHNLPENFSDTDHLRQVFSAIADPVSCQIVMRNGKVLNSAIIEYAMWEEADRTMAELSGTAIAGNELHLSYALPGYSATDHYGHLLGTLSRKYYRVEGDDEMKSLVIKPNISMMNSDLVQKLSNEDSHLLPLFTEALFRVGHVHGRFLDQSQASMKQGLLGPAPDSNPLLQHNTQLGLMIVLALYLYNQHDLDVPESTNDVKKEDEVKQSVMATLADHLKVSKSSLVIQQSSIFSSPFTAQACIIAQNIVKLFETKSEETELSDETQENADVTTKVEVNSMMDRIKNLDIKSLVFLGQYILNQTSAILHHSVKEGYSALLLNKNAEGDSIAATGQDSELRPKSLLDIKISAPSMAQPNKPPSLLDLQPMVHPPVAKQIGLLGSRPMITPDLVSQHIRSVMNSDGPRFGGPGMPAPILRMPGMPLMQLHGFGDPGNVSEKNDAGPKPLMSLGFQNEGGNYGNFKRNINDQKDPKLMNQGFTSGRGGRGGAGPLNRKPLIGDDGPMKLKFDYQDNSRNRDADSDADAGTRKFRETGRNTDRPTWVNSSGRISDSSRGGHNTAGFSPRESSNEFEMQSNERPPFKGIKSSDNVGFNQTSGPRSKFSAGSNRGRRGFAGGQFRGSDKDYEGYDDSFHPGMMHKREAYGAAEEMYQHKEDAEYDYGQQYGHRRQTQFKGDRGGSDGRNKGYDQSNVGGSNKQGDYMGRFSDKQYDYNQSYPPESGRYGQTGRGGQGRYDHRGFSGYNQGKPGDYNQGGSRYYNQSGSADFSKGDPSTHQKTPGEYTHGGSGPGDQSSAGGYSQGSYGGYNQSGPRFYNQFSNTYNQGSSTGYNQGSTSSYSQGQYSQGGSVGYNDGSTNYGQSVSGYGQSGAGYNQSGSSYGQSGAGYNQSGAGYGQSAVNYNQGSTGYNETGYNQRHGQIATSGYDQSSYGQTGPAPYSQSGSVAYGQAGTVAYGQTGTGSYGQTGTVAYGQGYGHSGYSQSGLNAYGQSAYGQTDQYNYSQAGYTYSQSGAVDSYQGLTTTNYSSVSTSYSSAYTGTANSSSTPQSSYQYPYSSGYSGTATAPAAYSTPATYNAYMAYPSNTATYTNTSYPAATYTNSWTGYGWQNYQTASTVPATNQAYYGYGSTAYGAIGTDPYAAVSADPSASVTPTGQKRSYSQLLPNPEATPEGDYVGQHSQGIGGHYAETSSGAKKQRLADVPIPPPSF